MEFLDETKVLLVYISIIVSIDREKTDQSTFDRGTARKSEVPVGKKKSFEVMDKDTEGFLLAADGWLVYVRMSSYSCCIIILNHFVHIWIIWPYYIPFSLSVHLGSSNPVFSHPNWLRNWLNQRIRTTRYRKLATNQKAQNMYVKYTGIRVSCVFLPRLEVFNNRLDIFHTLAGLGWVSCLFEERVVFLDVNWSNVSSVA